jgi:hypothetical protein
MGLLFSPGVAVHGDMIYSLRLLCARTGSSASV